VQEDRPGPAAVGGGGDVAQYMPQAAQMPVAERQQPLAAPVPRMPAAMPPRMAEPAAVPPRLAEPRPQVVAAPRPAEGAVRALGEQAVAPGSK